MLEGEDRDLRTAASSNAPAHVPLEAGVAYGGLIDLVCIPSGYKRMTKEGRLKVETCLGWLGRHIADTELLNCMSASLYFAKDALPAAMAMMTGFKECTVEENKSSTGA
ncbi:hypothetical protein EVG20_g3460 [Dentipellis fragilis]|uniref:Uncharacterized protein n=1 Tax=Dentipellis fragilis TaxID=205917 RepID=A0A4Y9Z5Q5_9AGAM|nr:hypothetical protein EVG20_g3460 [Dentipellis fragilis]